MALQPFSNRLGIVLTPFPFMESESPANTTIDAAGESIGVVGHVLLSTGPGTTKTLSSAGGKIHWRPATVTFANAGTTLRVGVNDVDATGVEDGTHDVHDDLVGGTDTITSSVINTATMSSGSKSITHGDLIAVVFELTARAGADSLVFPRYVSCVQPYGTQDVGAGPVIVASVGLVTIEFDDGTFGWFAQSMFANLADSVAAFGSSSTPDEHALIFRLPFPAAALGLKFRLGSLAAADDFEGILYSDPLGTPVAERTLVQDMTLAAASTVWDRPFLSAYNLAANTDYAIALRPTTANTLNYPRLNFGAGNGALRTPTTLGTNWSLGTRTNQTGAFTQDLTILPMFGVYLGQFDDATGGGGTEHSHVFAG